MALTLQSSYRLLAERLFNDGKTVDPGVDGELYVSGDSLAVSGLSGSASAGVGYTNPVAVSGAVTATIGKLHICTGASNYTIDLPSAAANSGKQIEFLMSDSLTALVTLDAFGSETIDGQSTRIQHVGERARIWSDGANWFKLGGRSVPMCCHMSIATNQSINSLEWTYLAISQAVHNLTSMGDGANNRITIRRTGLYRPSVSVVVGSFTNQGVGGLVSVAIERNSNSPAGAIVVSRSRSGVTSMSNADDMPLISLSLGDQMKASALVTISTTFVTDSNFSSTYLSLDEANPW